MQSKKPYNKTHRVDGWLFEFSPKNKSYLSLNEHRGAGNPNVKTRWIEPIDIDREFDIFSQADSKDWVCGGGHYWGIGSFDGSVILGDGEERLAKFPNKSNSQDPWHGYPVSTSFPGGSPPAAFIKKWVQTKVVSKIFGTRLLKKQV